MNSWDLEPSDSGGNPGPGFSGAATASGRALETSDSQTLKLVSPPLPGLLHPIPAELPQPWAGELGCP